VSGLLAMWWFWVGASRPAHAGGPFEWHTATVIDFEIDQDAALSDGPDLVELVSEGLDVASAEVAKGDLVEAV
jgi:hypothetical protein